MIVIGPLRPELVGIEANDSLELGEINVRNGFRPERAPKSCRLAATDVAPYRVDCERTVTVAGFYCHRTMYV